MTQIDEWMYLFSLRYIDHEAILTLLALSSCANTLVKRLPPIVPLHLP